jgi:hypothetical protein
MDRKIWIGLAVVIVLVLMAFLVMRDTTPTDNGLNGDNDTNGDVIDNGNGDPAVVQEIERVMNRLPRQFSVMGRTVRMDRQTVSQNPRTDYSIRDATTLPQPNEDPVSYIERVMRVRADRPEVQDQDDFYEFAASFYPSNGGILGFLNVANIPDDSIGETEERFEFVFVNSQWSLNWYGARHFCRRPLPGNWQPEDELCP